ncbi:MAG: hypothetical protein EOP47_28095 [Sphingobacteriaceae bacterium]|nr:MAG: hypothetical protein EOP47_28095 [Sphingobacteriaceae bacterium]
MNKKGRRCWQPTGVNNCGILRSLIVQGKVPCGGCGGGPIVVIPPEEPPVFNPYNADTVIIDPSLANYPCVTRIIDSLTGYANVNALAQVALHTVFGINQKIKLEFIADNNLPVNIDAQTQSGNMGTSDSVFNTTIHLNTRMLAHATQQYIAATIIHESVHAYIKYCNHRYVNNWMDSTTFKNLFTLYWPPRIMHQSNSIYYYQMSNSPHHKAMAANLIDVMTQPLIHLFPNPSLSSGIRDSVYKAISWGGLEEAPSFYSRTDTLFIRAMNSMARDTAIRVPFNIYSNGVHIGTHTQYDSHQLSFIKSCN